ncbi:hypothetical protein CDL15_Pgr012032 [Punica granatum]|uniref:Uncharacterized protein n=1 Tax=Punica granatum TaxID=22663 RepID=A0A218VVE9_PUNGR|nr:hypothetical protein CDL15_Pgr012032 [Punica granatum]
MVSSKENPISSFLKKSCQADQMIVFSSMHIYEEPYDSSQEEEIEPSEAVSEDSSWKTEESEDSYPSLKMMGRGLGVEDPDENVRFEVSDQQYVPVASAPLVKGNIVFTLDDIPYSK